MKKQQMIEIHIYKSGRMLCVTSKSRSTFSCRIGLGPCPEGPKQSEGDGRTPEGVFYVCTRNDRSKYTLFLGLSYPAPADAQIAFTNGVISRAQLRAILNAHAQRQRPPWDTPLGGEIGIHGGGVPKGGGLADNTAGCVALLDDDIRRLWPLATLGTPVFIHP